MSYHAIQAMPFGDIALEAVSAASTDDLSLTVRRVDVNPTLPDGMAIDYVTAFLIDLTPQTSLHNFVFDCRVVSCPAKGAPNSGENLDAQSWEIGDGLLMIGTEDGEALQDRMAWLTFTTDSYPITYLPDGFRVSIAYVSPKRRVDFHFVIAHNQINKHCDSEWFAVDIPHCIVRDAPSRLIPNSA